jgi:hypothetical protein
MATKSKKFRDARTGRYVPQRFADKNPDITVGETVKKPKRPKK